MRLKVRTNSRVKVPIGREHWPVRSRRQLRRREAGWRAAGSKRPVHKQNMMNSIRPDALASLLLKGEAKTGSRPVKGERQFRDLSLESTVSSTIGMHGVIGDRMVGSWSDMNQGSRTGKGTAFMVSRRPEEVYPGGDRASVVARKRGNARGAKGGRKVEA